MVDGWPPVAPETYTQLALLLAQNSASTSVHVAGGKRQQQSRPMAA